LGSAPEIGLLICGIGANEDAGDPEASGGLNIGQGVADHNAIANAGSGKVSKCALEESDIRLAAAALSHVMRAGIYSVKAGTMCPQVVTQTLMDVVQIA